MTACSVTDCDKRTHAHGLCKAHDHRRRRYGSPTAPSRMGPGPLNPNWHGEDIGYVGAHKRVHRKRGRAAEHTCVDCDQPAAHWSYDGLDPNAQRGPSREGFESWYSTNTDHYVPRCVSCHMLHDIRKESISA
jgi:hypothetical protein